MSRHAPVSHRSTYAPYIAGDQRNGDAPVSTLPPSITAWHSVLVTNLVTWSSAPRGRMRSERQHEVRPEAAPGRKDARPLLLSQIWVISHGVGADLVIYQEDR